MDVFDLQSRYKDEAIEFLKSKLGEDVTLDFWGFDENEETKYCFLKIFKLLFENGYDIALWNEVYDSVCIAELDENDFTKEEWQFIENIKNTQKSIFEEHESVYNINQIIETHNLSLLPINDEHICVFKKIFESNSDDFLAYSTVEYNSFHFNAVFKTKTNHIFAIKEKTSGEIIGTVALKEICDYAQLFNIEYFIFPCFRKKGYAVEACRALIDCGFSGNLVAVKETVRRGVKEVIHQNVGLIRIRTSQSNIASQNVAKKLGFSFDGIEKRGYRIESLEKYEDLMLYSLEKDD